MIEDSLIPFTETVVRARCLDCEQDVIGVLVLRFLTGSEFTIEISILDVDQAVHPIGRTKQGSVRSAAPGRMRGIETHEA